MDNPTLPPGNAPAEFIPRLIALDVDLGHVLRMFPEDSEIHRLLAAAQHAVTAVSSCVSLAASMVNDQLSANRLTDSFTELLRSGS